MRARARVFACLLALLPLAGCVDAVLDDGGMDESLDASLNESNATNGSNESDGPLPVEPTPTTPPSPPTVGTPTPPTPTTAPPIATPPPTPPPPPTPAPTAPPPTVTPPPPTPTPPPPTPTPPPPTAWPREGSYVTYTATTRQSFSGSPMGHESYVNVTWTFTGGDWRAVCEGHRHERDHEGTPSITPIRVEITSATPPHWPPMNTRDPPAVGEPVTVWYMRACTLDEDEFSYAGTDTETAPVNGAPRVVDTHRARSDDTHMPYVYDSEWSRTQGLVLHWSLQRVMTQAPYATSGRLVDTDAPL